MQYIEVTVSGGANDQEVVNRLHYFRSTGAADTALANLTGFEAAWVAAGIPDAMADNYTHQHTMIRDIVDVTVAPVRIVYGEQIIGPPNPAMDGAKPGPSLPTLNAVNVQKVSSGRASTVYFPRAATFPAALTAEKLFRGRIGFGPIAQSGVQPAQEDLLTVVEQTDWQNSVDGILTFATALPSLFEMVNLSVYYNLNVRNAAAGLFTLAWQPTSSLIVHLPIGSQNSRKKRRLFY